jgi:hypothetical protein
MRDRRHRQRDLQYGFEGHWRLGSSGRATWAQSSARVRSSAFAWRAQDVDSTSDQRLVSPAMLLPGGELPLTLQFWNHQTFEPRSGGCWDGGLLEISTNGGATYTPITAGLLTDPYDGPLGSGNPAAGLSAWCGDPQDWMRSVVDLAPWAGQTVHFASRDVRWQPRPGARRLVPRRHQSPELFCRHDAFPPGDRGQERLAVVLVVP